MKKRILLLMIIPAVVSLAGCSINFNLGGGTPKGPDGGIYKSTTNGEAWQSRSLVPTTAGKATSLTNLDATVLVMDPSDSKALYYGTIDNGLFLSLDAGESWLPLASLGRVTVNAMGVDPLDKCNLYAAVANRVMKSIDCGRTWKQAYYDNELDVDILTLAIDHYDSRNVYIGTSRGDIIISNDGGDSWRTLERFDDEVQKLVISPTDSRIIFAATEGEGIFRSSDAGASWLSLEEQLKEFPDSRRFRDLYVSKVQPGLVILANNYGLLKTINYGDDWTTIPLITPEKEAIINAVVISERNPLEIYYVTNTTFYSTIDGGDNWTTKKLPSTRAGRALIADGSNAGLLYLAVKQINN